jgi:hypothetical protein
MCPQRAAAAGNRLLFSGVERQTSSRQVWRAYVPLNAELRRALGVRGANLRIGNNYNTVEAAASAHDR